MPKLRDVGKYLRSQITVTGGGFTGRGYPNGRRSGGTDTLIRYEALTGNSIDHLARGAGVEPHDRLTLEDEYSCSPWFRALMLLSTAVALRQCRVMKVETVGGRTKKTPDPNHPAYYCLSKQSNTEQTAMMVRAQMAWNAAENSVSFAAIFRDEKTGTVELIPFVPGDCWKERVDGELLYFVDVGRSGDPARQRILRPFEVFELTAPQPDGIAPVPAYWAARIPIYECLAGGRVRAARSTNKGRPATALTTDQKLDEKQIRRMSDDYTKIHRGLDDSFRPLILDNGVKPMALNIGADQASEANLWRLPIAEISNITGVPASLLGIQSDKDQLEDDYKRFQTLAVDFWLAAWCDQADAKLLTDQERRSESRACEFKQNLWGATDAKTLAELARVLAAGAPMGSINEVRGEVLQWEPLDDPQANTLQIPKNIGVDGSVNNLPKPESRPNGRPGKASAEQLLVRATASRVCGRICNAAVAKANDATAYLEFCPTIVDKYSAAAVAEIGIAFAAIGVTEGVAEAVHELVAKTAADLDAVPGRVTAKAQMVPEVQKVGRRLRRAWESRLSKLCVEG